MLIESLGFAPVIFLITLDESVSKSEVKDNTDSVCWLIVVTRSVS
jgi:hypothetical protein